MIRMLTVWKVIKLIHSLTTPLGAYSGRGYLVFVARVQPRINTYHLNHPCTQFVPRGKVSFHRQPKPMNPHYTQQPSYDIDRKIKSEIINTFKDTTWVPPLWPRLRRMTRFAYVLISIKLTNFKATIHDNLLGPYIKEAYILIDGFSCNNHIPMSSSLLHTN